MNGFYSEGAQSRSAQQALYELVNRADPAAHGSTESVCAQEVSSDKQPASQGY